MEAHPREFAETVMRMASLNPSAGWVHGIVGVHPWQLAFADPKVQQEIWDPIPTPGWHRRTCPAECVSPPPTAATSSPVAGSSPPVPTIATGHSSARWRATRTATWRCRRACSM